MSSCLLPGRGQRLKPLQFLCDPRGQVRLFELRRQHAPRISLDFIVPTTRVLIGGCHALLDLLLRRPQTTEFLQVDRHMKVNSPFAARIGRFRL